MYKCPTCGRSVNMTFYKYTYEVMHKDGTWEKLSKSERKLLKELMKAEGIVIPFKKLERVLWPDPAEAPQKPKEALAVFISTLRKKIAASDVYIETLKSEGYYIGVNS